MEYSVSCLLSWKEASNIMSEVISAALSNKLTCCVTWQDSSYWYTRIEERSLHKEEVRTLCQTAGVPFVDDYAIFPDDEDLTRDISMGLSLALLSRNLSFKFDRYFYDEKGLVFADIQPTSESVPKASVNSSSYDKVKLVGSERDIPIWEKITLSVEEAAVIFRIGENKLRRIISENDDADFVLWNGNRPQIKRKKFEDYINNCSAI